MIPDLERQRRINFIVWMIAFALCVFCIFASIGKAEARTHRHAYQQQTWAWPQQRSYYQQQPYSYHYRGRRHREYRPNRIRDRVHVVAHHRHSHKRKRNVADANGNRASKYATVTTANGLTAKVIASAQEKFQKFIDDVEAAPDLGIGYFVNTIKGNRISDIGCLSRGHMPGSKHHWGGACDFAQVKRNITRDKFMYRVSEIAHKHGLIDGCEWQRRRGERYTGPDCGHIEVASVYAPSTRTASASRHHRHHRHRHRYRLARR